MSYGSNAYGSASYSGISGGAAGATPPIEPPIPTEPVETPIYIGDSIQVEAALAAWHFLAANGLTDGVIAGADTVEDIEAFAASLHSILHEDRMRVLLRTEIMLKQSEDLGILTDDRIDDATTVAQITAYLQALLGVNDGHDYTAYYQGC